MSQTTTQIKAEAGDNTLGPSDRDIQASIATYSTPWTLFIYDWWVLGVVSTFAWQCSVSKYILPFFKKWVGKTSHLDIGVGTGYYLVAGDVPKTSEVVMMDLNKDALDMTEKRVMKTHPPSKTKSVTHDAFRPLPAELGNFDAVSLFYFLHCLPGTMEIKCSIFKYLAPRLNEGGCVYGANILGSGVKHNLFARLILTIGNRNQWFTNRNDNEADLRKELNKYFEEVETNVVGCIVMFRGAKPKKNIA